SEQRVPRLSSWHPCPGRIRARQESSPRLQSGSGPRRVHRQCRDGQMLPNGSCCQLHVRSPWPCTPHEPRQKDLRIEAFPTDSVWPEISRLSWVALPQDPDLVPKSNEFQRDQLRLGDFSM